MYVCMVYRCIDVSLVCCRCSVMMDCVFFFSCSSLYARCSMVMKIFIRWVVIFLFVIVIIKFWWHIIASQFSLIECYIILCCVIAMFVYHSILDRVIFMLMFHVQKFMFLLMFMFRSMLEPLKIVLHLMLS